MVVVAAATAFLMVMVVMMVVRQLLQFLLQGLLPFHGFQQLCACEFIPGGNHQGSMIVTLPQQSHGSIQLCLGNISGAGQDDGGCGFDLIIIKLAKILHVDLDLTGISHSYLVANDHIVTGHLLDRRNHIAELAHAGGLDDNAIGVVLLDDLGQRLAEVAHQRAADAAGIHFGDIDAGILQETPVNADLAEFIFDQHQVFTLVGLLDHFLDKGGLTGAEEAGINVNFGHKDASYISCLTHIIAQFFRISTLFSKKNAPMQDASGQIHFS